MMRRNSAVQLMRVLTMAVLVASCANATTQTTPPFGFRATPPVVPIPVDVRRMAVLYPRGETPERSSAYGRLEGAAFLLKTFRPTLKISDRFTFRPSFRSSVIRSAGMSPKRVRSALDGCWEWTAY